MLKCDKCGRKLILARGYANEFTPDEEPHESSIQEDCGVDVISPWEDIRVYIEYCTKCKKTQNCWLESDDGEILR